MSLSLRRRWAILSCRASLAAALLLAGASAQALPPQLFHPEWLLPSAAVPGPASGRAALPSAPRDLGSVRYLRDGQKLSLEDFQSRGSVKALLVVHDGRVVHEHHRWPHGPQTLHQSWSMMKQVLATLVGMAQQQGRIASLDEPMDRHAPALARNGFAGVTYRQALLMSTGVRYEEEVDRVTLFKQVIAHRLSAGLLGHDLQAKTTESALARVWAPGSRYAYTSIASQALVLALEGATGQPLHSLLTRALWQPLGMPDDARLLTDAQGQDFGLCCLYATARSYAVFGQWVLQGGRWGERQLLGADWLREATTFDNPRAWRAPQVPRPAKTEQLFGFGHHWWPLEGGRGDFTALGIHGQMVYVSPAHKLVVVRLSDDHSLGAHNEEAVAAFRAVADHLQPLP